jgi:hypothetical protein
MEYRYKSTLSPRVDRGEEQGAGEGAGRWERDWRIAVGEGKALADGGFEGW